MIINYILKLIYGNHDARISHLREKNNEKQEQLNEMRTEVFELKKDVEKGHQIRKAILDFYQGEGLQIWEVEGSDRSLDYTGINKFFGVVAASDEDEALTLVVGPQSGLDERYVRVTNVTEHYLYDKPKVTVDYRTLISGDTNYGSWKTASLN